MDKDPFVKARSMTDEEHKELQVCGLIHLQLLENLLRGISVLAGLSLVANVIQTILLLSR